MVVSLSGCDSRSMGIPMMFPLTWEENTAANMTKIPLFELFPGLMVSDLYKAYRSGLDSGAIQQYDPASPDLAIINYVASNTGKSPEVVADFFTALVKTINAGKAPANVLSAQAATGIGEKTQEVAASAAASASSVAAPLGNTVKWIAIGVAGVAVIYGLSVARPFLKRV